MKFSVTSLALVMSIWSAGALAEKTAEVMVSIDKKGVRPHQIKKFTDALNFKDHSMGTCFVESSVQNYIPYTDAPYYGVAILSLKWECDERLTDFLMKIHEKRAYTVYPNSEIGPFPGVSGSN